MKKKKLLTTKDVILMLVITVIYSAIAFYNLGDRSAPQTILTITPRSTVTVDMGKMTKISSIKAYLGAKEMNSDHALTVVITDDDNNEWYKRTITDGSVFCWSEIKDIDVNGRYISFGTNGTLYLSEIGVLDENDELLSPASFPSQLFDEQSLIPDDISYRNSTYFDEIYHARTGYEFVHGLPLYEWTHPPLGKIFISLGIKLFGMTPFGWRVTGTVFGILMVPAIYVFLKKMFNGTFIAVCGTLLFTFDFMHFSQTRIATIDVYVTFFIMLMYMFMYKYYTEDFSSATLRKIISSLIPCGLMTGLAIACKWTGIYAAVGLAVIFFITFARLKKENGAFFGKTASKIIIFCIFMFGAVPILIYALSYIPFINCSGGGFGAIIQNQIDMLTYHGKTVVNETHSFSSPWYEWPIDFRPIWYYTGERGGLSENISAFGNPAVWWTGIAAFVYCVYDAAKNKDKNAMFLVIAYLSQLVPWIPVTRITFIYHYFPCVPFIVLMICHSAYKLHLKKSLIILTVTAVILFAAFYPAISGFPVPAEYVKTFLRWLPSWQLIG